jgi:hypothetical protein
MGIRHILLCLALVACDQAKPSPLLVGLSHDEETAFKQLEERLSARFPLGTPESRLLGELEALGFDTRLNLSEAKPFCSTPRCVTFLEWDSEKRLGRQWNVEWTVDKGQRITSVRATGAILN